MFNIENFKTNFKDDNDNEISIRKAWAIYFFITKKFDEKYINDFKTDEQKKAKEELEKITIHITDLKKAKEIADIYSRNNNCETIICKYNTNKSKDNGIKYDNKYEVISVHNGNFNLKKWEFTKYDRLFITLDKTLENKMWEKVNIYNDNLKKNIAKEIEKEFKVIVIDYNFLPLIKACIQSTYFINENDYFIVAPKKSSAFFPKVYRKTEEKEYKEELSNKSVQEYTKEIIEESNEEVNKNNLIKHITNSLKSIKEIKIPEWMIGVESMYVYECNGIYDVKITFRFFQNNDVDISVKLNNKYNFGYRFYSKDGIIKFDRIINEMIEKIKRTRF